MKRIVVAIAILAVIGWFSASLVMAQDTTTPGTSPQTTTLGNIDTSSTVSHTPITNFRKFQRIPPFVKWVLKKRYDTNGDGKLEQTERDQAKADMQAEKQALQEKRQEFIKKYDTNGDGKLDATERAAARKDIEAQRQAKRSAATLNGGTSVTPTGTTSITPTGTANWKARKFRNPEAKQRIRSWMLKLYDTNHDGKLDDTERAQMKADLEQFRAEQNARQQKREQRRNEWRQKHQNNSGGNSSGGTNSNTDTGKN